MNNSQKFNFQLGERFLENYADPPEDHWENLLILKWLSGVFVLSTIISIIEIGEREDRYF